MIEELLKKIKADLEKRFDLEKIDSYDFLFIHFGICAYIRNKYLWKNPELVKILNKHFKTEDVDTLSHAILKHITKKRRLKI